MDTGYKGYRKVAKEKGIYETKLLNSKRGGKYLRISERSIYKLVREGKIPGTKILNK